MNTPHQILGAARSGELERLGVEADDVAGAVRGFAEVGDAASALELVAMTWRMWLSRGEIAGGSAVVAAALAIPRGSVVPWEVRALYADGLFAFRAGDQVRSLSSNAKALVVARQTGDVRGECDALTGLARVALRDGRYQDVVALARQARDLASAQGDDQAGVGPLHLQAAGTRLQGEYPLARELYLESLRLNTELGNATWVWTELHNLGWVELHLGNVEAARSRFQERDAATQADAHGEAWKELNWSAVAAAEGDLSEARRRYAAGTSELERLGMALDPDDRSELDWLTDRLRTP
jgi:tetratricopeptide (TPR) repeat protein